MFLVEAERILLWLPRRSPVTRFVAPGFSAGDDISLASSSKSLADFICNEGNANVSIVGYIFAT